MPRKLVLAVVVAAFLWGAVAAGVLCAGCSHSSRGGYGAAAPTVLPTATPSPSPTATPSPSPSPTATPSATPSATPGPTPTPVTYRGSVKARVQVCTLCHVAGGVAGGTRLVLSGPGLLDEAADVATLRALVDLVTPASSPLLQQPSGAVPHSGGVLWPPNGPAYADVLAWIRGGAQP